MSDEVLRPHDGFSPAIERRDGRLIVDLPIASGHFDLSFEIEISEAHLQVLQEDERRFHLLWAALDHLFQLPRRPDDKTVREYLDTILFSNDDEVSRFMSEHDAASNGALSSGASNTLKLDRETLREGNWFGDH